MAKAVSGIIILDKPANITSFKASDLVREKLGTKKAGHAGTLDPAVTGILIVALNDATKTLALFSRLNKTYQGTAHLHKEIEKDRLEQEIKKFIGKIKQLPPKKSRVKRVEREREIYNFKILEKKEKNFSFQVCCEAGTYIRKLIHDLGQEIGGAHMSSLRRIEQGPFSESEAIKLQDISEKDIIPMEQAIKRLNVQIISVSKKEAEALKQGKFLKINKENGNIVVFSQNKIVAIATIENNFLKPKRIIPT